MINDHIFVQHMTSIAFLSYLGFPNYLLDQLVLSHIHHI